MPLGREERNMSNKNIANNSPAAPQAPSPRLITKGRALNRAAKGFTVRFSAQSAAEKAQEKGVTYDLTPEEKEAMLCKLLQSDFSKVIEDGLVKQNQQYNPLASTYFPHMWSVPAGGKRTPMKCSKIFLC